MRVRERVGCAVPDARVYVQELFERYCIGTHIEQRTRIERSARRVGLGLPKLADQPQQQQQQQ